MTNTITYDARLSDPGEQVFRLGLFDVDDDAMWHEAQFAAMRAIGSDQHTTFYEDLKPGRRRQFNVALQLTQAIQVVKAAHKTEQVRWLLDNGVDFEVDGKWWAPFAEEPEALITIYDDDVATMFKLTFGGDA